MKEPPIAKAAFSQTDITPSFQTTLIGRWREKNAQGILHRLYGQVLLLGWNDAVFCLIAMDHLGLNRPLANTLRAKVAAVLGIPVCHVMLNFSHTHSAPDPTSMGLNGERYFDFLCGQIEACVKKAAEEFFPCQISWSLSTAGTGVNRREGCTITDNRLGGLLITRLDTGAPLLLAARISTHPNILPGKELRVSSDFFGAAREKLADYPCPVMLLQGAAGNIKAAGTNKIGEGDGSIFERNASLLAESIRALKFTPTAVKDIQMCSTEMPAFCEIPARKEAEQMTAGLKGPEVESWLQAVSACAGTVQSHPIELQLLKINDGCLCGVPEELFCEISLDAAHQAGTPLFFLNGYTNGVTGYFPTSAECKKGGYEDFYSFFAYQSYTGRLVAYRPETADALAAFAAAWWKKLLAASAS